MIRGPERTIHHPRRYREIPPALVRHALGELVDVLALHPYLAFPRRPLRRWREEGPPLDGPERLRLALEEMSPTFIKLGQVLSKPPDLVPLAFVAELSRLQDAVPSEPWEPVRRRIESELGKLVEELSAHIDRELLAAASLAQADAATLPSGSHQAVGQSDLVESAGGRSHAGPRAAHPSLRFGGGDRSSYRRGDRQLRWGQSAGALACLLSLAIRAVAQRGGGSRPHWYFCSMSGYWCKGRVR